MSTVISQMLSDSSFLSLALRRVVVGGGPGGDNLAASNPFDEPPGPRRPPGT